MTKLALLMERRKLNQADLIRMTGLTRPTIQRAMRGLDISPMSWVRIARSLDCNVYEISPETYSQIVGAI